MNDSHSPADEWSTTSSTKLIGKRATVTDLVMVLSVLACSLPLLPVGGTSVFWAITALPSALCGCASAVLGRSPAFSLRRRVGPTLLLLAQCVIGPVIALPHTTIAGIVPTVETLRQGAITTIGSFKFVISVEPPLGTDENAVMAMWTLTLWSSFIAVSLASSVHRILDAAAVAVILLTLGTAILLGTRTSFLSLVIGVGVPLTLMAWSSWHSGLLEAKRTGRLLSLVATSLMMVFLIVGFMEPQRKVLRDLYEPPLSLSTCSSPLSQMRAFIKKHKEEKLLTVTDLPQKTPVRLAVMDLFDGVVWNISDSHASADSADYRRVGTTLKNSEDNSNYTATFTLHHGMEGIWFPLVENPTSINPTPPSSASVKKLYFNASTDTALLPSRTYEGMKYTVTGTLPKAPTAQEIRKAVGSTVFQPTALNVPTTVSTLAHGFAPTAGVADVDPDDTDETGADSTGAGATSSNETSANATGRTAQRIADGLRASGWFSHGLSGDYPSLAGHGSSRLASLLNGASMVGDSEQYASAMALMVRDVGLSSRVVLGFIPKDASGRMTADRTTKVGKHTTTTFTGNDIEAWVEINLENYGWVAFFPTPEETKTPDENQSTVPPDPQAVVRQPPVPLQDPLRDERKTGGTSLEEAPDSTVSPSPSKLWQILNAAKNVALYGSPLWVLLVLAASLLLIKFLVKRHFAQSGTPTERVTNGWIYLESLAILTPVPTPTPTPTRLPSPSPSRSDSTRQGASSPPPATRQATRRGLEKRLGLTPSSLIRMSRIADSANFSQNPLPVSVADSYWEDVDIIEKMAYGTMTRFMRWKAKLAIRPLAHFLTTTHKLFTARKHHDGVRLSPGVSGSANRSSTRKG